MLNAILIKIGLKAAVPVLRLISEYASRFADAIEAKDKAIDG